MPLFPAGTMGHEWSVFSVLLFLIVDWVVLVFLLILTLIFTRFS